MAPERLLRICAVGNANSVAVQIRTRWFALRGHDAVILSPFPADVRNVQVLAPSPGHTTVIRRAASYLQMVRMLYRWHPDVVLVHFASLPFNWLLPLVWFKPLAVTLAGGDILFHQRPDLSPRRRRATIDLLDIADGIISKSDYMLASYPRLQSKAMVTGWGVDLDKFSDDRPAAARALTRAALGLAENTPVILSPRRVVPVCGIASIVEALTYVRERVPNAVLLLINDQPDPAYRQHVLEIIEQRGLADRITWINSVDHDDMPDLFRLADVTVSVARSDGMSGAVLESMAARTPVVLGDIPNYAGIFADREHCRMVDPNDPRSIAAGVADVLTDSGLRAAVIENARAKVVEQADLGREAERVETMLCAFANSRSRPLRLAARVRHALNLAWLAVEPDSKR